MKKLSILVLSVLSTLAVFAQPEKGNIFLGGSLNLDITSSKTVVGDNDTKGPRGLNFGLMPKAGYFVSDKILVGVDLGFNLNSRKFDVGNTTTTESATSFGGGLFARYYILPAERFAFFFEGGVNTMFGSQRVKVGSNTTDGPSSFQLTAGITPGIVVYVSKKVALEASYGFIGYSTLTETDKSGPEDVKNTNGGFGLNVNPGTFRFGVSVLF